MASPPTGWLCPVDAGSQLLRQFTHRAPVGVDPGIAGRLRPAEDGKQFASPIQVPIEAGADLALTDSLMERLESGAKLEDPWGRARYHGAKIGNEIRRLHDGRNDQIARTRRACVAPDGCIRAWTLAAGARPRAFVLPSFANEYVVGLQPRRSNCAVLRGEAERSLWTTYQRAERKLRGSQLRRSASPEPADVNVVVHERPLDGAMCARIDDAWLQALSENRYPEQGHVAVLDGVSYHFVTWRSGYGFRAGVTTSPHPQTLPGRLVAVAEAMAEYAHTGAAEDLTSLRGALDALEHELKASVTD